MMKTEVLLLQEKGILLNNAARNLRKKSNSKQIGLSSIHYGEVSTGEWIDDGGASVHLVRENAMLSGIVKCDGSRLPDGGK